jgi:outer membrane lipoprotein-sorting protein
MKKYILLFGGLMILLAVTVPVYCQQDPEAKKILEEFTAKTKSYSAYQVGFTISSENHQNGEKSENKGTILIKGSKYKMEINHTEIYFDGKNIYNFTRKSNEVSIVKPNKNKDDFFLNNPSNIFTIYTKEYKFQYLGETKLKNKTCYEIDLYPMDLNKKYSIIKLLIDKEKLELVSAQAKMKSGVTYTVSVDTFNPRAVAQEKDFSFDVKAHNGVEVVDMR